MVSVLQIRLNHHQKNYIWKDILLCIPMKCHLGIFLLLESDFQIFITIYHISYQISLSNLIFFIFIPISRNKLIHFFKFFRIIHVNIFSSISFLIIKVCFRIIIERILIIVIHHFIRVFQDEYHEYCFIIDFFSFFLYDIFHSVGFLIIKTICLKGEKI